MSTVQVDLPESLIKKLRVLRMLTNQTGEVTDTLESLVNQEIAAHLGLSSAMPARVTPVQSVPDHLPPDNISSGLGDKAPAEDDEEIKAALREMGQGLTDADLENDLKVENPDHEAKAEAKEDALDYLTQAAPQQTQPKRKGAKVSLIGEGERL